MTNKAATRSDLLWQFLHLELYLNLHLPRKFFDSDTNMFSEGNLHSQNSCSALRMAETSARPGMCWWHWLGWPGGALPTSSVLQHFRMSTLVSWKAVTHSRSKFMFLSLAFGEIFGRIKTLLAIFGRNTRSGNRDPVHGSSSVHLQTKCSPYNQVRTLLRL